MRRNIPSNDTPATSTQQPENQFEDIYHRLQAAYGDATWHWAPEYVRGPLDVIAGAILVQHTTWQSAERALEQLRDAGALDVDALLTLPDDALLPLVSVSGTPTVKLRRLRALAGTIAGAGGVEALLALPAGELRARLLATHGVGPETADAIALYAGGKRVFVIDAYTVRTFTRIGIAPERGDYASWQRLFEDALPSYDAAAFQRYHAYIVLHAKDVCRASPRCGECALGEVCAYAATSRYAPASSEDGDLEAL
jgi:endonuclease-3 related protein